MSDRTSSEDESSIELDRDGSPDYKILSELQGKRSRETGLT
ncbi:hypothetical protein [Microcoleus sp. K4-C2]